MINPARLIKRAQRLIRIDSQNPPGDEENIARFIVQEMKEAGLKVQVIKFKPRRCNVIITLPGLWPRKKAARESLLLTPHMDTVPCGQGWKLSALSGKVQNGKITGRGATDDKGNLACSLEVMRSLKEDGVALNRDLILAATADEETGSHLGILPLLEKNILRPKAAVILDSDEFDTIVCQKGLIHARVQIFGKKAHAAYNWRGSNAIEIAARVIKRLTEHQFSYSPHPLLKPPTKNIGKISGGDKVNIVADFCEFALDIRYLPGMQPKEIYQKIQTLIRRETKRFKFQVDDCQLPYAITAQHPLVKIYRATARKMGVFSQVKGSEGATVITFFKKKGIPAFATGFGSRGTAHCTDEYAQVHKLIKGARLLERFVTEVDRHA